jgi:hypothetical protein
MMMSNKTAPGCEDTGGLIKLAAITPRQMKLISNLTVIDLQTLVSTRSGSDGIEVRLRIIHDRSLSLSVLTPSISENGGVDYNRESLIRVHGYLEFG